jgi:hypothetical protein
MEEKIIESLRAFRAGDDDTAIASLLEIAEDILPSLSTIYRNESDSDLRAFLVRVAWERREEMSVNFILEALNDPAEEVWQSALDGTVALASPEMLDLLKSLSATERGDPSTTRRFQICVDEAILYVDGLLQRGHRPQANYVPPAFKK